MRIHTLIAVASLAIALAGNNALHAQAPAALSGQVSSAQEGAMEGVLVSAKRNGATITITVSSDHEGHFSFPASRLEPGQYALRIRAVGYELDGPKSVEVAAGSTANADVKLRKTNNLAAQLTNAEWMASFPGTDQQKIGLVSCVVCHSLERIVKSSYDAEGFMQVVKRMGTYSSQSTPLKPQLRPAVRIRPSDPADRVLAAQQRFADYVSTINLSQSETWNYQLKTFPRPTGRNTHAIITEYDLPRQTMQPHDVIVTADGSVWFSNFGETALGRLDAKTGKVTEYPLPELKKGYPTGSLSIRADADGNPWLGMMSQGAVAKFDRKTETFQVFPLPPEHNKDWTQVNMVRPEFSNVDGKVWLQDNGTATIYRLDPKTGVFDTFEPFKGMKEAHNPYDVMPSVENNIYFTDFSQEHIGYIDVKTGKTSFYKTPSARTAPRRGMVDAQDRVWFAEYRGNRIGMFDPKTQKISEWLAPTPWSEPYDVAVDKNGEAWTGSMLTDRVLRLDPTSDRFIEYLLPRSTNIRRSFVDNSTPLPTYWSGSNHGASIVKLEPLD
jgi:virginiamycin B lyase